MAPLLVTQEQYDRLQAHITESKIKGMNRNKQIKTTKETVTKVKMMSQQGVPHKQIIKKLHIGHPTLQKILKGGYD